MQEILGSGLQLRLVVAGMHLSHEFGNSYQLIEQDGFEITARVDMLLSGDNHAAMAKSIGIGIYGMVQALESLDPDVVLVLGDRVEAFAGAVSGAGLNKVVAHLHGGEVTRGGLDESMRHAISKFAHLHFVATENSRLRLMKMGERPETIHQVGAPGLDTILTQKLHGLEYLREDLGIRLKEPFLVIAQHPVSTDAEASETQMRETLEAVRNVGLQAIVVYPNSDSGGRRMIAVIESYRNEPWLHIFRNLSHVIYLSLLSHAAVLIGNSSSGILEAPSFRLPVINIGSRQAGRERSTNVIDVPSARAEIEKAIRRALHDTEFRSCVGVCVNPYGDGKTSQRVVEVIRRLRLGPHILQKQLSY
jgi:UDP-N-acetylglucosamine 2-epimerase (non-hydrolysing)/GDP/UDP-N,N'-diacetylbacillosamine 2-epimerase (hydrolysing)